MSGSVRDLCGTMWYVAIPGADEAALAEKFAVMKGLLGERQWRVYLGTEANALGYGGVAAVARASGASPTTVAAGAAEAADPESLAALRPGRSRRDGAGRPGADDAQPGLRQALGGLLEEGKRGDPMSEITWSVLSLRDIAAQMALRGFACGKDAVSRLMREDGWSLRGMSRVAEGSQHPDRDAQFRHINARIAEYQAGGEPVVSVDGKKKERLGAYHRDGRSWRPAGDPVRVRDHDFPEKDTVTISPYGVYDITANRGFVSVGISHETAAFAVKAIRLWWQEEGQFRYEGAARLLVTCDSGGSNAASSRLWKDQLAVLAEETGLVIEVCHFPPGTSKWNKIEHRLFCHITRAWKARPLMTVDDAVAGIAATITSKGLKCHPVRDRGDYPEGVRVPDARMRHLEDRVIERGAFHGEWNYALLPAPRPAPDPGPGPGPGPRAARERVPAAALNHPALTGMTPEDVNALVAALELPFAAWRDQRNRAVRARKRGAGAGDRVNAVRNGGAPSANTRLALADHVLAALLRGHLALPEEAVAVLLGAERGTICRAAAVVRELITDNAIPLPPAGPPPPRPRTPAGLIAHAAAAGLTLELPNNGKTMPKQFKTRQVRTIYDTPETTN
jgi:Rhodopirellula transposase DDE domain